jgi:hypothetical protein
MQDAKRQSGIARPELKAEEAAARTSSEDAPKVSQAADALEEAGKAAS